jgi:hypothetical protein
MQEGRRVILVRSPAVRRNPGTPATRNSPPYGGTTNGISVLALAALVIATVSPLAHAQQARPKKELNVDFTVGWAGRYRPMEWTPITLSVTSPLKEHVAIEVGLSMPQDEQNVLKIRRLAVLEAENTVHIPLTARTAYGAEGCDIRMSGVGNNFSWSRHYELWGNNSPNRPLTAVTDNELLIGVSGRQAFGLAELSQGALCRTENHSGAVHVAYRNDRLLPVDWPGYACLDLLVLYDSDWDKLTPHQSRAIADWVSNGGRLLLVLGSRALPADHPLAAMLPFRIGPAAEVSLPAAALDSMGLIGLRRGQSRSLTCWSLEEAAKAPLWRAHKEESPGVLMASGPAGLGFVGVLGFDPDRIDRQGLGPPKTAEFWVSRVERLLPRGRTIARTSEDGSTSSSDYWTYRLGRADAATGAVLEHLHQIVELRPLHAGWIVAVLAALALLIGPVDYFVLKRLNHLPLTWLTASLWIALFSVGAYYGVQYLRAGDLKTRAVTVTDGVADGNGVASARSTCYAGIYSPASEDYGPVGPDGKALDRGQWWSGLAPTQNEHLYYRGGMNLGTRNIYCVQHEDGGNLPVSVPINIWSMQSLLQESSARDLPIRAKVARAGRGGQWNVTLANLSPQPVERAYVLVPGGDGQVWTAPLGSVPAKDTREFTASARPWTSWQAEMPAEDEGNAYHDGPQQRSDPKVRESAMLARGTARRSEGILSRVAAGAAAVCAEFDASPLTFALAGQNSRVDHLHMVRLVVEVK